MNPLQSLVEELLTLEGALVAPLEPEGLEVLAPPPLQAALGLPEWFRLGFGTELPDGARRVSLESEWMTRVGDLLGEGGRWLTRVLPPARGSLGDPERALEHGLALANASFRLRGVRPAWTRYLVFTFRYTALSDEKRDGLVTLGVNTATGAVLDGWEDDLAAPLPEADGVPPPPAELPAPWPRQRLAALLDASVAHRVRGRLEPFVAGLARRQDRDLARLASYYGDLRREALDRLARLPAADRSDKQRAAAEREEQRLAAVAREYRAKVSDLGQKYALRVTLEWVQTLELVAPVERLEVLVRRRKGERLIALDWNPRARRLEPAPCEHGHTPDRVRLVCDDALHLVAAEALAPCPGCGKSYCRACHPDHCPKCGRRAGAKTPAP
ncbi:MAG: RING finger protein [Deferrisomatales bacterium]